MRRLLLPLALLLCAHCQGGDDASAPPPAASSASTPDASTPDASTPDASTPTTFDPSPRFPVGHASFVVDDPARSRKLTVHAYYPAAESARAQSDAGMASPDLQPAGALRDLLSAKWPAADSACVRARASVAEAAPLAEGGPFPVVAFSHCTGCFATSSSALLEALAARGFVVVAPDHQGNTLVEAEAKNNAPINEQFLALRAGDIAKVLDVALDGPGIPGVAPASLDAAKVGMLGHSYGALTTGLVAYQNPRVKAALAIAAPMEFIGPAKVAEMKVPVGFLVAREDHSINEAGNQQMRAQASSAPPPAWIGEVTDAGHWSFSDVPGLVPAFKAGCGAAKSQVPPYGAFDYLPAAEARAEGSRWVVAFFEAFLKSDEAAAAALASARPLTAVTLRQK